MKIQSPLSSILPDLGVPGGKRAILASSDEQGSQSRQKLQNPSDTQENFDGEDPNPSPGLKIVLESQKVTPMRHLSGIEFLELRLTLGK